MFHIFSVMWPSTAPSLEASRPVCCHGSAPYAMPVLSWFGYSFRPNFNIFHGNQLQSGLSPWKVPLRIRLLPEYLMERNNPYLTIANLLVTFWTISFVITHHLTFRAVNLRSHLLHLNILHSLPRPHPRSATASHQPQSLCMISTQKVERVCSQVTSKSARDAT
jgi:hypothetical protein